MSWGKAIAWSFGISASLRQRSAKRASENPKTLEPVAVPEKRTVKFKVGRLMKQKLGELTGATVDDEAGDIDEMNEAGAEEEDSESDGVQQPHHGHSAN